MAINSIKTWEAEAVDYQDMNTGIRNHLVHVVSSRSNLPSDMRQEPGVPWIELSGGAAVLKINDATGSPVSVQSTINPTVSDPFRVTNLIASEGITLGGQRLTAWPTAGAGASTWIGLSDTPGDYGQVDQIPVSLGAGSDPQRIRWQSFASLIPPNINLTGNLSVGGNLTLGGQTRDTWPAPGISNFVDCHDVNINLSQAGGRYVTINPAGTQIIAIQPSFLTSLAGVTTFSGTPADGKVLTGTSATTASWETPAAAESFDLSGVTTISGVSAHGAVLAGVNATTAAWSTTPSFSGLVTFQSGLTIPANEGITLGNVKRTTWPSATTGYSGTQETGAIILATDASVAAWTTTPTFGGLITASSDGISLGGVTRTTWPAGVEFGATLPTSPTDGDVYGLTGEDGGEGRGFQEAKSRTIQQNTNTMTFQVQDQSWGVQEFYGFAIAQARSGDASLIFGSQPAGYPKVKAFIWSIQLREIYVQVDADTTDQAAITIHAFGNQYDLNDRTSHFGPAAVGGKAQKVYYKNNLSIPASSNQLEQTISVWRTGNVNIGIPIGQQGVTQSYWIDFSGGRPVVSGNQLPDPENDGFSVGDNFLLNTSHGSNPRGEYQLHAAGVIQTQAGKVAILTKGTQSLIEGFSLWTPFGSLSPNDNHAVGLLQSSPSSGQMNILDTLAAAALPTLEVSIAGTKYTFTRTNQTFTLGSVIYRAFSGPVIPQLTGAADGATIQVTFPFDISTTTFLTTKKSWQLVLGGNPVVSLEVLPDPVDYAIGDICETKQVGWHGGKRFRVEDASGNRNRFIFTAQFDGSPTPAQEATTERGYSQITGIGDYGLLDDDGASEEVERTIGALASIPNPTAGYTSLLVNNDTEGVSTLASLTLNVKNLKTNESFSFAYPAHTPSTETGYSEFRLTNQSDTANMTTLLTPGDAIQVDIFESNGKPWNFRSSKRWLPVSTPAQTARELESLPAKDRLGETALTGFRIEQLASRPSSPTAEDAGRLIWSTADSKFYIGKPVPASTNRNRFAADFVNGQADVSALSDHGHLEQNYGNFVDEVRLEVGGSAGSHTLALVVRLDIASSLEITSEPATLYLTHLGFPAAWNVPATLTLTRRAGYDRGYLTQNVVHLDSNTFALPDAQVHIAQSWNGRATLNLWTNSAASTGLNFKPFHAASVAFVALDTTP